MKKIIVGLLSILFLLAVVPVAAQSPAGLFIAPDGNDANACTITFPCLTIPRAASLAQPGDTVYLRSGVYYSRNEWQISGRNSITVTAYPADIVLGYERPIVDATYASLGATDNILQVSNSQTVTVSRIEFRNSSGRGISSAGSSRNVTFFDVKVHHIGERCIGLVGSYITLDAGHAYECALNWKDYTGGGGWPGGVASWWKSGTSTRSDHIAIVNSTIQWVYGEGVIFLHADDGFIYNSFILDSKSVNLYIDDANRITVDRVTINNRDTAFLKSGRYAHGIEIANENGTRAMTAITITNSFVTGADNALYYFCFVSGCSYGDLVIHNNRLDGRSYSVKINTADGVNGVNVMSGNVYSGTFQISQAQFWNISSNLNSGVTHTPTRPPTQTRTPTWTPTRTPSATSSPSASPSPSLTPSSTASPTASATPTETPVAARNPYGVMLANWNSAGVDVANTLGAGLARLTIFTDRWDGTCAECDRAIAGGLKLVLTIRANGGAGVATTFPPDIAEYVLDVRSILAHYGPWVEVLVAENEENSSLFWASSVPQYHELLGMACAEAHAAGVKCANGGLVYSLTALLTWQAYRDAGAERAACSFAWRNFETDLAVQMCGTPPANTADYILEQVTKGRTLLAAYKESGADVMNFHSYAADYYSNIEMAAYLKSFGLPVMIGELGEREERPANVASELQACGDAGLAYCVWFSVDTASGQARALQNADGSLRPTGEVFRQWVTQ